MGSSRRDDMEDFRVLVDGLEIYHWKGNLACGAIDAERVTVKPFGWYNQYEFDLTDETQKDAYQKLRGFAKKVYENGERAKAQAIGRTLRSIVDGNG